MRRSRLLIVVAWLLTAVAGLLALGAVAHGLPWLGYLATSASGTWGPQLVVLALVAAILAGLSQRRSRRVALVVALLAIVVHTQTVVLQVRAADRAGASIDWADALLSRTGDTQPTSTATYATVDGQALEVDVYQPPRGVDRRGVPVLQVHGGGFTAGNRKTDAAESAALAREGFTVFAIDYRLGPTPTFDKAAPDVACAAAWIAREAQTYDVDTAKLVMLGSSAGGGLVLEVAYGRELTPSCAGDVPPAAAVVAYYAVVDRAARYEDAGALKEVVQRYTRNYLGGSPQEQPARYRDTDPVDLVSAQSPPTLLITGEHDHVTGTAPQRVLAEKLERAGVRHELVELPRTDHAFNALAASSIPAQAARAAILRFLS